MYEVYRNADSSTVGLLDGILKESGIDTLLKNWTGSNIIEIPIPILYPTLYVLDAAQVDEARQIIEDYLHHPAEKGDDWECPNCQSPVDGYLSECWSCQTERTPSGLEK